MEFQEEVCVLYVYNVVCDMMKGSFRLGGSGENKAVPEVKLRDC